MSPKVSKYIPPKIKLIDNSKYKEELGNLSWPLWLSYVIHTEATSTFDALENREDCGWRRLESPLGCKESKPVKPKGDQPWMFIGRTDAEAPNTLASWCEELTHWKRPWWWERLKAGGEGDNRGWDGWTASLANRHEFEQTPGDGEEQGSLARCSPWGCKVGHDWVTEQTMGMGVLFHKVHAKESW